MSVRGEIREKVDQWLGYADDDLQLASHALLLGESCPYRLVAYHGQQCAEKCLKAFLVWCEIDFPYTHNISILLELVEEHVGSSLGLSEAEELSPYAITARYPGEDEEVTGEEAKMALEIAGKVKQEIRKALSEQGY